MKAIILPMAMLIVISTSASARTIVLKGDAAENFISTHLPNATIPGPVSGAFKYIDKRGRRRNGVADCQVPAMGGRSEGAISECTIHYN